MRRRSRPWVSPGRPLRFEYLCFAPRAAYTLFACLPAFWDVRERCGAVRPARGARRRGVSPRGLSPAGGAAPTPAWIPSRAPAGMFLFCSQRRVQAFCRPPGGFGRPGALRGRQACTGGRRGCFSPGLSPRRENVIAVGASGAGKTHAALGPGLAACQRGMPVGGQHGRRPGPRADGGPGRETAAQAAAAAFPPRPADRRGLQPALRAGLHPGDPNLPFDEWTGVFGPGRLTGADIYAGHLT